MFKTPDIPSNLICNQINPQLFLHFQKCYFKQHRALPSTNWTEADVVQWLDTEYKQSEDKYFYDTLDKNSR
jgi:hypothetical protein